VVMAASSLWIQFYDTLNFIAYSSLSSFQDIDQFSLNYVMKTVPSSLNSRLHLEDSNKKGVAIVKFICSTSTRFFPFVFLLIFGFVSFHLSLFPLSL
jgi:hypothetical protein